MKKLDIDSLNTDLGPYTIGMRSLKKEQVGILLLLAYVILFILKMHNILKVGVLTILVGCCFKVENNEEE